jgi:hypothetical protein
VPTTDWRDDRFVAVTGGGSSRWNAPGGFRPSPPPPTAAAHALCRGREAAAVAIVTVLATKQLVQWISRCVRANMRRPCVARAPPRQQQMQ